MRRGFTLTELLVCIAIIAVLAAFLFPTLTRAKQSARVAEHTSQLRQLGQAWAIYSDDNDDDLPLVSKLYASGMVDHKLFQSQCDPNPRGWTHYYPSGPEAGYLYPSKVSVLDYSEMAQGFGKYRDPNVELDILYSFDGAGWALMPGCDAKPFFTAVDSMNRVDRLATFYGSYTRLRMDTSVVRREVPHDAKIIETHRYFLDDVDEKQ